MPEETNNKLLAVLEDIAQSLREIARNTERDFIEFDKEFQ